MVSIPFVIQQCQPASPLHPSVSVRPRCTQCLLTLMRRKWHIEHKFYQQTDGAAKGREHMATDTDTKQYILDAFQQLFEARKSFPFRLAIREEVAEKERDK